MTDKRFPPYIEAAGGHPFDEAAWLGLPLFTNSLVIGDPDKSLNSILATAEDGRARLNSSVSDGVTLKHASAA